MNSMKELEQELKLLVQSGHHLIYLLSFEELRAKRLLEKLAQEFKTRILSWSIARGIEQGLSAPERDPNSALNDLIKEKNPGWFLFFDFHPYLEDPYMIRALREIYPGLVQRRQYIFIIAPVLRIPLEMEKDIVTLELPLPDAGELGQILEEVFAGIQKKRDLPIKIAPDLKEKMVRAGLGLTEREAQRVFLRALIEHPEFKEEHLDAILFQKKQIIRQQNLLEFCQVSENLEEVGGLDLLKDWLRSRSRAFSEDARKYGLPEPRGRHDGRVRTHPRGPGRRRRRPRHRDLRLVARRRPLRPGQRGGQPPHRRRPGATR